MFLSAVCLFVCFRVNLRRMCTFLFSSFKLRFVLAPGPTVASQALVPKGTLCTQIEVCLQAGAMIESMSEVIAKEDALLSWTMVKKKAPGIHSG